MSSLKVVMLTAVAFLCLPPAILRAQSKEEDVSATILAMERDALDHSDKGDVSKFLEISAPDVVYIDPFLEKPIYGLEALRTYYKGFPSGNPIEGKMANAKVQLASDEVAVLTYNYIEKELKWNCTEVFKKTPAGWRIFHTHWSPIKWESPTSAHPKAKDISTNLINIEKAALDSDDAERFLHISEPTVAYIDPVLEKPIYSRDELRAHYFQGQTPSSGKCQAQMLNQKVQVVGDAAVLSFNYRSGGCVDWNATEVYHNTKKGWRILQTHWSYVHAQPAQ